MRIEVCSAGGIAGQYRVFGSDKAGPTLVLLGGVGAAVWQGTIDALGDRYRIVSVDFPGLTATLPLGSGAAPTIPDLGGLAVDAVRRSRSAPVLVGWSLGAQVAVAAAALLPRPPLALVLICGLPSSPFETDDPEGDGAAGIELPARVPHLITWLAERGMRLARLRRFLARLENPAAWAKRFDLIDPFTDEAAFNLMIQAFLEVDPDVYHRYTEAMAAYNGSDGFAACPSPVLLISGERDILIPSRRMARLADGAPGREHFDIKGATHYAPIEYPDLLGLKIDAFLKDYSVS